MTDETKAEGPSPEQIERDLASDPFAIECFHCALWAFTRKRAALRLRAGKGLNELDQSVGHAANFLGELCGTQPEVAGHITEVAMMGFAAGLARGAGIKVEIVNVGTPQAPETKH